MKNEFNNQAYRELYCTASAIEDADIAVRKMAALTKAIEEIETNDSIVFTGDKLTFNSLRSGKQRIVTIYGCDTSCDCQNIYSYHRGIYDILFRATSLEIAAALEPIFAEVPEMPRNRFAEQNNSAYFQKTLVPERKVEKVGNVRI